MDADVAGITFPALAEGGNGLYSGSQAENRRAVGARHDGGGGARINRVIPVFERSAWSKILKPTFSTLLSSFALNFNLCLCMMVAEQLLHITDLWDTNDPWGRYLLLAVKAQVRGLLRTSTGPMLNRRTESARLIRIQP